MVKVVLLFGCVPVGGAAAIGPKCDLVPFCPAGIDNLYERALHIRKLLLTLPRSVLIVMRYLFAFLNQ